MYKKTRQLPKYLILKKRLISSYKWKLRGTKKVGKGSFTPNTQLPRPVQKGNCKIKKDDAEKARITKKQ